MKKLLTVLIMSVVALSVVACGDDKPADSSASAGKPAKSRQSAYSAPSAASMK